MKKKSGVKRTGARRKPKVNDEATTLTNARMYLASDELPKGDFLRRWAELVITRHDEGRSIANAEDWLGAILAGMDTEDLE